MFARITFTVKRTPSFLRFSSARHHPAKIEAWIAAVRSRNTDGSPWQPNEHCRICRGHFVKGTSILYAPKEYFTLFNQGLEAMLETDCVHERYAPRVPRRTMHREA
ncbi:uncharacterized protein ISCGN_007956 [Ixodes scapularis]